MDDASADKKAKAKSIQTELSAIRDRIHALTQYKVRLGSDQRLLHT
jgi:hypothetical protein